MGNIVSAAAIILGGILCVFIAHAIPGRLLKRADLSDSRLDDINPRGLPPRVRGFGY